MSSLDVQRLRLTCHTAQRWELAPRSRQLSFGEWARGLVATSAATDAGLQWQTVL